MYSLDDNEGSQMANTYIRSSNDYTVSAHSTFFNTYNADSTITKVYSYSSLTIDNMEEVLDKFHSEFGHRTKQELKTELRVYDKTWQCQTKDNVNQKIIPMTIGKHNFVFEFIGDSDSLSVVVLSDADNDDVHKFFDTTVKEFKRPADKVKENTFYTISHTQYGFDLDDLTIKGDMCANVEDLYDNYNENFQEADSVIKEAIDTNQRGLMLLHGVPGSGKTSFIRHLIVHGSDRKIVYVPTHLAGSISSPEFISFVKDQLTDTVLVIEDAEQVLIDRNDPDSHKSAVANILNMTDGILADALNILIVCTFNTDIENLDKALLRKGRLKLRYEFEELSEERANNLTMKLFGKKINKPSTLAEIYNLDYELIAPEEKKKHTMGFR